jgi:hypothetical protein
MSETPKTVSAKILRDFNDAGTEKRFTAGETVEMLRGEYNNFAAGGLVELVETAAPAATPETTPNKRG